jgi:hypothetical protein
VFDIASIKSCFDSDKVLYSSHAVREMRTEPFGVITEQQICEAILSGEIIESYPADTPYPSALVYGKTGSGRPLHAVCAYDEADRRVVIVTVYHPDPNVWIENRRRKR